MGRRVRLCMAVGKVCFRNSERSVRSGAPLLLPAPTPSAAAPWQQASSKQPPPCMVDAFMRGPYRWCH
eukprot:1138989-Pelagomonas_calceolata.AAC.1